MEHYPDSADPNLGKFILEKDARVEQPMTPIPTVRGRKQSFRRPGQKSFHTRHVNSKIIKWLLPRSANQDYVTDRGFHCRRFQKQTNGHTLRHGPTGSTSTEDWRLRKQKEKIRIHRRVRQ